MSNGHDFLRIYLLVTLLLLILMYFRNFVYNPKRCNFHAYYPVFLMQFSFFFFPAAIIPPPIHYIILYNIYPCIFFIIYKSTSCGWFMNMITPPHYFLKKLYFYHDCCQYIYNQIQVNKLVLHIQEVSSIFE